MKKSEIARMERNTQIVNTIVAATKPLIVEEGYENLTIREICANAGITTGMFYRHFVSKDDVLTFCYMQDLKEVLDNIDDKISGLPLAQQLVTIMVNVLTINRKFGPASVYMFINRNTTSTSGSHLMRNILKDKTLEIIENAVASGFQLSEGRTPDAIFNDISVIMKGLTSEWYMVGLMDIADQAQDILGRLMVHLL